jgi:hypothetical protein
LIAARASLRQLKAVVAGWGRAKPADRTSVSIDLLALIALLQELASSPAAHERSEWDVGWNVLLGDRDLLIIASSQETLQSVVLSARDSGYSSA